MSGGAAGPGREGLWDRVARVVSTHPVRVLVASLATVLLPALAVAGTRLSHDTLEELPADAESVRGVETLADHFPPGEISPVMLVVEDSDRVLAPASLRALGDLSRNLKRMDPVASVRSVAMPTDGRRPELPSGSGGLEGVADLSGRLQQAADGAEEIEQGLGQLVAGLERMDGRLPELRTGLGDATDGAGRLLEGIREARAGIDRLQDGLTELRSGLVEAREGTIRLHDDVAVPAEESIRAAWSTLRDEFTVGQVDPAYRDALEQVGRAYGRITGEDPRTGEQVEPGYAGLPEALAELSGGLDEAVRGVGRLEGGVAGLDGGLGRLEEGLGQLRSGLRRAEPGVGRLADGVDQLLAGARRLRDGAGQLQAGLADGVANIEQVDVQALLPGGEDDGPFVVTPGILEAMPEVRDQLGRFTADDGTRTRIFVGLDHDAFSPPALAAVDEIREIAELSLQQSPLEDATVRATGITAFLTGVDRASDADLPLIIGAVVAGVFLVLVLLLRSLVAPIYMVVTVLLSFASALGLTTLLFQGLLGHQGLAWWLPPFLFVLLVALGADYNIYLMSRVREEAEDKPTRRAVADATRSTGSVITSAGLILAGTFAALLSARMTSLVQMGFAATVGILLDTFVVRSLLVPAIATLLGRHNWWPSRRSRAAAEG